ncbi:MAG: histidine phosphatase family protein [Betaproteobacteria bacterium]|nr:histidine phosphatase family protein [Betaproteobacteria bacterium]
MDLILWRHAEAEDGLDDLKRALTDKGQRQAMQMAQWIKKYLPATAPATLRILVSPALRTQQTARALGWPFVTVNTFAPGATPEGLLEGAIEGMPPQGAGQVLIVGHQPTLGALASHLLTGQPGQMSVRKGGLLWLRLNTSHPHPTGAKARLKTATLLAAMTPGLL